MELKVINKKEITLSKEDVVKIITEYLETKFSGDKVISINIDHLYDGWADPPQNIYNGYKAELQSKR